MIEITKVYEASNGDVFFLKKEDYKKHTPKEIDELIEKAKKMYQEGNFEKCNYVDKGGYCSEYFDKDNKFLGNEQIHIISEYRSLLDGIYLKYTGDITIPFFDIGKKKKSVYK